MNFRDISLVRLSRLIFISCGALLALHSLSIPHSFAQEEVEVPKGKTLIKTPASSDSATARGPIVKEIEIEYAGPKSVDRTVIYSNMRTAVGQPYSLAAIEEDVKNLYATGLFVNLRIYDEPLADGVKVVVIVQPKPIIKQIVIIGTQDISEKAVRKKLTSKAGEPLSEQKVAADEREIKDYYRTKGFHKATVEYKIDINEQVGRAVVTFTIQEKGKAWVRYVNFEGNKSFEAKKLRKLFETRKKNLFSFLNKSGLFKEDQFQEDLKKLRNFYWAEGYIDMKVEDIEFEYDEEYIDLTITLFEGIQYRVGSIGFKNNTLFTRDQILGRMALKEGGIFSPQGLEAAVQAIRDLYGENGYIDIRINPQRQPNIESGKMDISFDIDEGPQSYIEKIVIQGNNRTKDKVLRRELAIAPGDVYDSVRVDASKRRLENLNYFSKVDISAEETPVPNRKDMVVTVEEKRTGSVTFGAGFSTVDSLLGFVELTQGNFDYANWPSFTGGGQKFRARAQYGIRRQDFIVSWTEPWFLDRQLSFGFDGFYNDADFLSSEYSQRRYGGTVRFGKALNQFWRIGVNYTFENIDIYDVDDGASSIIRAERGGRTKSSVRANLVYESRDSLILPRRGEKIEFFVEGAGGPLAADTDIWKLGLNASKHILLPYDLIVNLKGGAEVVDSYDNTGRVPIFDRLFLGGSRTVRGFDFRDIGPRDNQGEPIGGGTTVFGRSELTFPIMDRVRGAVFVDSGFNELGAFKYSITDINVGTGVGLRLDLPIGPLKLDLGFPVLTDGQNETGTVKFHFDVGYEF